MIYIATELAIITTAKSMAVDLAACNILVDRACLGIMHPPAVDTFLAEP